MNWKTIMVVLAIALVVTLSAGCVKQVAKKSQNQQDVNITQLKHETEQLINETQSEINELNEIDLDII